MLQPHCFNGLFHRKQHLPFPPLPRLLLVQRVCRTVERMKPNEFVTLQGTKVPDCQVSQMGPLERTLRNLCTHGQHSLRLFHLKRVEDQPNCRSHIFGKYLTKEKTTMENYFIAVPLTRIAVANRRTQGKICRMGIIPAILDKKFGTLLKKLTARPLLI